MGEPEGQLATLFLILEENKKMNMLIELKLESNEKMMVNIVLIKGYVKEGIRKVPEYLQLHT